MLQLWWFSTLTLRASVHIIIYLAFWGNRNSIVHVSDEDILERCSESDDRCFVDGTNLKQLWLDLYIVTLTSNKHNYNYSKNTFTFFTVDQHCTYSSQQKKNTQVPHCLFLSECCQTDELGPFNLLMTIIIATCETTSSVFLTRSENHNV